jgi:hypothetical protein
MVLGKPVVVLGIPERLGLGTPELDTPSEVRFQKTGVASHDTFEAQEGRRGGSGFPSASRKEGLLCLPFLK